MNLDLQAVENTNTNNRFALLSEKYQNFLMMSMNDSARSQEELEDEIEKNLLFRMDSIGPR